MSTYRHLEKFPLIDIGMKVDSYLDKQALVILLIISLRSIWAVIRHTIQQTIHIKEIGTCINRIVCGEANKMAHAPIKGWSNRVVTVSLKLRLSPYRVDALANRNLH